MKKIYEKDYGMVKVRLHLQSSAIASFISINLDSYPLWLEASKHPVWTVLIQPSDKFSHRAEPWG